MTLPRLIRKPQVDELGRLESMTAECWQGDPRGQAVSKWQRRQRLKSTFHGGERTQSKEAGGSLEGSEVEGLWGHISHNPVNHILFPLWAISMLWPQL